MKGTGLSLLAFHAAIMTISCHSFTNKTSSLRVSNGIDAGENFPAVVKLIHREADYEFICSGTAIGETLVATAAHCLDAYQGQASTVSIALVHVGTELTEIYPTEKFVHPLYESSSKTPEHDLAVLKFESIPNVVFASVSQDGVKKGDDISIVGYGNNVNFLQEDTLSGSGVGKKRFGYNKVFAVLKKGLIAVLGTDGAASQSNGNDAATGIGDSGGALFNSGKLVGSVGSAGLVKDSKTGSWKTVSYFVDLSSSDNANFLMQYVN